MRPNDPDALEAVGGVLLKQGQHEAAVPYFERYIKVSPNAPHAWRGLFLAQSQGGKNLAAIETARRFPQPVRVALVKDPLFLRQLAVAYQATGHDADAQRVIKAALELPVPTDSNGIALEDQLQYADLLPRPTVWNRPPGFIVRCWCAIRTTSPPGRVWSAWSTRKARMRRLCRRSRARRSRSMRRP